MPEDPGGDLAKLPGVNNDEESVDLFKHLNSNAALG